MSFFQTFEWASPLWFLAFLPLGWLAFLLKKKEGDRRAALRMSMFSAFEKVETWRAVGQKWLPVLRVLAFSALILALARPRNSWAESDATQDAIDIMLAMDLSSSMLAKDFSPDRLAVSKAVAIDFVKKRPFDRIGLAVFAGEALALSPVTTDHEILENLLENLSVGRLTDGTAIGMGLAAAVNRLQDSTSKSRIVILVTDGVNNSGYIQPQKAAEIAQTIGVKVYTIGVGSLGEALSPVSRTADGDYIFGLTRVEIDENLMQSIAQMTGGRYFRAATSEDLSEIYAIIDKLEKTERKSSQITRHREHFGIFLGIAFFFLMLEAGLRWGVLRSLN